MAIAVNSQESGGTGHRATSSPLTWNFNNVAGTKLLLGVVVASVSAVTMSTPTYNSVSGTLVGSQLSYDTGKAKVAIYYWDSPAVGTNGFSIAFTGGAGLSCIGGAISFTGAAAGVGTNVTGTVTGATSVSASSAITTASGNYIFATGAWGSGLGGTAGSGFTRTYLTNGSAGSAGDDGIGEYEASAGSAITPSFSWTGSDTGAIIAVEITVSGGGGAFVPLVGGPGGMAGMPMAGVGGGLAGRSRVYSFPHQWALRNGIYVSRGIQLPDRNIAA